MKATADPNSSLGTMMVIFEEALWFKTLSKLDLMI